MRGIGAAIRCERAEDVAGIAGVHRAAFRREDESRLVGRLRQSAGFDPQLSLVAVHENEIVGHILFTTITVDEGDADGGAFTSTPAMALAPLAVLPTWQRQGVGTQLMLAGMDACRQAGHRFVIVIGHPRYYPRFGFVTATPLGIDCPFPVPPETFMFLDLSPEKGIPLRGRVRYPAPFHGLPEGN